ncbi:hypothetical protein OG898_29875 [Streptomyces sp. NBC_00193]|uniref:hypothetical protein n=1 Tax=Streptomyces sp. NBC_00193 TaxID=2975675 RepID=UPI002257D845|nr:hypothetical protein [Streptomyces sp. NBC_00193]MCX5300623.1 hypothetical protein [Streptomyces sp. NBC_00193]
MSDVMVGGDPFMVQGTEAVKHCAEETGASCAGLVAVGGKGMEVRGNSSDDHVEFRLYSFETDKQAGAVMKSLADTERKSSAE